MISLLGPVRAWADGCPLLPGTPVQQALLAMLALRAGQEVSVTELIEGIAGAVVEEEVELAEEELHLHASRARRLFLREGDRDGAPLHATGVGYRLLITPTQVDAIAFEHAVGDAQVLAGLDPAAAELLLDNALARWRGVPLQGVPGPFAEWERARLWDLHQDATVMLRRLRLLRR
ncbi:BTAD domain-containing putative transcriptional regulator [Streptacidiphilus sp. MAP12-20]|uniref:AfsR/SARP family transcriptional regulator n=1 Tax=Streptacidiphilus sp. MAP12-20 TaxID=3156299 RepID=UPI0035120641